MGITKKDVDHVAWLARLQLTQEERQKFTKQLGQILEHATKIQKIDTSKVKPTAHVMPLHNVFRKDNLRPSLDQNEALSNAPQKERGGFVVPKIV